MARVNPLNERHIGRLRNAMDYSRERMQVFRERRLAAIKEYVGAHYSNDGNPRRVPINLLELATNIYIRKLAAKAPRVLIGSEHEQLKSTAAKLTMGVNHLAEHEIGLEETFQETVVEAIFSPHGIVKIGLERRSRVEIDGYMHDVGQPFVDPVPFDDWVQDMSAGRWDKMQYSGNRYRLPLHLVKDSDHFIKKTRDKLVATKKETINEEGDERAESVSQGPGAGSYRDDEYVDHVELYDLWLPLDNIVLTLPAERGTNEPLAIVDWDGPEVGPYRHLMFNKVPGNLMGLPPIALWMDLHELANLLFRKLGRQASRQKMIYGVQGGATMDGKRIQAANDGDMVGVDSPAGVVPMPYPGADPANLAFFLQVKDLFTYLGGNLDALGGLGPQSETLGQDKLLTESASERLANMQDKTVAFAKGVMRDLAYYTFTDPLIELPLTKRIPGSDIGVPVTLSAEDMEGDFLDYNFSIDPYSMQNQTPASRLGALQNIFSNFIAPFIPMLQEQGITVSFETLFDLISRYGNLPEIKDLLNYTEPPSGFQRPIVGDPPRQSPVTNRINTRVNRPGATTAGKDQAAIMALMGAGQQGSQLAAVGRPTG